MRHFDLADRTRNRFTGQVDFVPSDVWMFSVSGGILNDDFGDTVFGLQESSGRTFSLAADYHEPNGLGAGATYNLERYDGLQQSHEGDKSDAQFNDPLRNWTSDSTETVHYFSIYATPPRIGRNTEVRFSYDFSHAAGNNLYTIPVGSPIPTPNQLPEVFNKLQQLHIDARYRIRKNLAGTFSYLYEPLSIYDYAFDPSVVNGIVQPSSLVMGYVYRPYTANSSCSVSCITGDRARRGQLMDAFLSRRACSPWSRSPCSKSSLASIDVILISIPFRQDCLRRIGRARLEPVCPVR